MCNSRFCFQTAEIGKKVISAKELKKKKKKSETFLTSALLNIEKSLEFTFLFELKLTTVSLLYAGLKTLMYCCPCDGFTVN